MPVLSSETDAKALTLTFVAEFDAPIDRVWQIWESPRQLERWWGPPDWPAKFETHEFSAGGRSEYVMTGPDSQQSSGWWTIHNIDEPSRLEFEDGFLDDDGQPVESLGTIHDVVTLEPLGGKTRMTVRATFESTDQFDQVMAMGMEDGMRSAMGQIDAILAETQA